MAQSPKDSLLRGLFSCISDTVDGSNPKQPPGMYKALQIMG